MVDMDTVTERDDRVTLMQARIGLVGYNDGDMYGASNAVHLPGCTPVTVFTPMTTRSAAGDETQSDIADG